VAAGHGGSVAPGLGSPGGAERVLSPVKGWWSPGWLPSEGSLGMVCVGFSASQI